MIRTLSILWLVGVLFTHLGFAAGKSHRTGTGQQVRTQDGKTISPTHKQKGKGKHPHRRNAKHQTMNQGENPSSPEAGKK